MGPGPRTAWTQRPMIRARSLAALLGLLLLAGCLAPSKADLIKKAEGANSRNELEAALGEPSEVSKLGRSEEHTSELQSLMRISYAVFCLKKKNTTALQYMQINTD